MLRALLVKIRTTQIKPALRTTQLATRLLELRRAIRAIAGWIGDDGSSCFEGLIGSGIAARLTHSTNPSTMPDPAQ